MRVGKPHECKDSLAEEKHEKRSLRMGIMISSKYNILVKDENKSQVFSCITCPSIRISLTKK